jgi:major vault protein
MKVLHVPPYNYVHLKDKSENTIFLIEGPISYVLQSHEELVRDVTPMQIIPPNNYMRISNPVMRDENNKIILEEGFAQAKLLFGEEEIRTYHNYPNPFPLYPGEEIKENLKTAKILSDMMCVYLEAIRDFFDERSKSKVVSGEKYMLKGPMVYYERVEEKVIKFSQAEIIHSNTALLLSAEIDLVDSTGVKRKSGDRWLVREVGSYFPGPYENVIKTVEGLIIKSDEALSIRANNTFVDIYNKQRKAGEIYLITNDISSTHIEDVHETVLSKNKKIVLNKWQYCRILDPMNENGVNQYGTKITKKGPASFFLQPNETLEKFGNKNIASQRLLSSDEALLVRAIKNYKDEYGTHLPGERWMIYGPRTYIDPIEVFVIETRKTIPLDDSEGIYVRDIFNGEIKMVTGTTYMLKAHEEFWNKELPKEIEYIIQSENHSYFKKKDDLNKIKPRDSKKIVTYTIPHNSVVQIFDYKDKKNRIEFGPCAIKLGPYEQFTMNSLSGNVPSEEDYLKSIIIRLGPDFFSDEIEVETSDHARLSLKLLYSWKFDFDRNSESDVKKLFEIKDFVGDCCKAIASRVRGVVSSVSFDSFHKDSSNIIQTGVFGLDVEGKLKKPLKFKANNLIITNIDIRSLEPIDNRTREILNKSMILSMQTNIQIQESEAYQREQLANQEAHGRVERNQFADLIELENTKLELLMLKNQNIEIETVGRSEASSKAKSSEMEIRNESNLIETTNRVEEEKKYFLSRLEMTKKKYEEEIRQLRKVSDLEIKNKQLLAESVENKLKVMVETLGRDTLVEMARAGPESQANILKSLGIKSMIVTDGKNPLNIFNTANGMMGVLPSNN